MSAKVMTANLLRDGDVVYLTAAGNWSLWLSEAEVARDESGEADGDGISVTMAATASVTGCQFLGMGEGVYSQNCAILVENSIKTLLTRSETQLISTFSNAFCRASGKKSMKEPARVSDIILLIAGL